MAVSLAEIPNIFEALKLADQKTVETAQQIQQEAGKLGANTAAQAAAVAAGTVRNTGKSAYQLDFENIEAIFLKSE